MTHYDAILDEAYIRHAPNVPRFGPRARARTVNVATGRRQTIATGRTGDPVAPRNLVASRMKHDV